MFKDKQIPLETSIKRRSQEIEENSTLKPSDIMNLSQPLDLLSNPIGRRSSNGSISDKLMTLMGSENVQEVNYSEIKCKLRRRRSTVVPYNRVVKLHKETSTSSQKIRKISSQSALRACNRPKPKLMATVMLKEKEDALNSGLIKTPLRESTFITNINDFTDKTLTWVNKTSRRPVCGRRESIVNRCPSIKTNLKGRSKTIIARKINRRAMAPLSYRMNRLFTLHDSSQAEIFCVFILQTYTAELLMQSGISMWISYLLLTLIILITASPEPITWPPNVIWYWYYYEDYILKKAKSLPAPRIGMRLEFYLDQLLSDNVEIHQTKFSFWRVFLKVFLLILISMSLFVFGWLYGKSFIKWWMRLLLFYWKLLKLFWFSALMWQDEKL